MRTTVYNLPYLPPGRMATPSIDESSFVLFSTLADEYVDIYVDDPMDAPDIVMQGVSAMEVTHLGSDHLDVYILPRIYNLRLGGADLYL